jgi:hypothetical protein
MGASLCYGTSYQHSRLTVLLIDEIDMLIDMLISRDQTALYNVLAGCSSPADGSWSLSLPTLWTCRSACCPRLHGEMAHTYDAESLARNVCRTTSVEQPSVRRMPGLALFVP